MNPVETPILQAKHLNLYYGEKQALKDINIDIPHNEITALIGPSGCGKSTALDLLAMILPPSAAEKFLFNAPGDTPEDVAELWRRGGRERMARLRLRTFTHRIRKALGEPYSGICAAEYHLCQPSELSLQRHGAG